MLEYFPKMSSRLETTSATWSQLGRETRIPLIDFERRSDAVYLNGLANTRDHFLGSGAWICALWERTPQDQSSLSDYLIFEGERGFDDFLRRYSMNSLGSCAQGKYRSQLEDLQRELRLASLTSPLTSR